MIQLLSIAVHFLVLLPQSVVPQDSLITVQQAVDDSVAVVVVDPWDEQVTPGFSSFQSDSTMRWILTLDGSDLLTRIPGLVSYRTGTSGRSPGFELQTYTTRDAELSLSDLKMNDPVNEQIQWLRLPVSKIRQLNHQTWAMTMKLNAQMTDQYLTQPRTFLNFYESRENYRSLEFAFSQNLTSRMNVELSYWDRKDGSRYTESNMNGSQTILRGRYHLNDNTIIKMGYQINSVDQDQPFGYQIAQLNDYHFNPYNTSPEQSNAFSTQKMNDFYLQLHSREDVEGATSRMFGISRQTDEWFLPLPEDTSHYAISRTTLTSWQELMIPGGSVRLQGVLELLNDKEGVSLPDQNWTRWNLGFTGELLPLNGFSIDYTGNYTGRSDSMSGYELSGRVSYTLLKPLKLSIHGGVQSRIPDLQSLYWQSPQWNGFSGLLNEQSNLRGTSLIAELGSLGSEIGLQVDRRNVKNELSINDDMRFTNSSLYQRDAYTAWVHFNSPKLEGSLSVTHHRYQADSIDESNRSLVNNSLKTWVTGGLYWKNYIFNRAAYLKAGFDAMYSPGGYNSASYLPRLNRWINGHDSDLLPSFYTADINVSARIRWMMLLIRWENVLDQIQQPGYFETAGYPMPGRRLIFGLRVLFTN